MKQYISLGLIIGGLIFGGCVQSIPVYSIDMDRKYDSKHVIAKSYTINTQQIAFIGEPMISVKDYNVVEKMSDKLKSSEDFFLSTMLHGRLAFQKGETFTLEGNCDIDGKQYKVVKHTNLDFGSVSAKLLIDNDGVIINKHLNHILLGMASNHHVIAQSTYTYEPASVRLLNEKITETSVSKGSLNYELVYTGKDKDSLKILYREYTSEDMAKPSFYQTLTYDLNSKKIRFKNITMQIISLDNEKITFTVVSDT